MVKLLVVGVDPGTTTGYAILDIQGDLKKLKSSKRLNLSSLIFEVIREGKVLVVGTDVNPAPSFVKSFANKIGAKVIYPGKNLQVREKKRLTVGFKVANLHERDALAAAFFAFKKIKSLLRKVDSFLKKEDKERFSDKVKELLLTKEGLSITKALNSLEEPKKKMAKKVKKKIVEVKPKKLSRTERENILLKKQNEKLKNELKNMIKKEKFLTDKLKKGISDEKFKSLIQFKDSRIKYFISEIEKCKNQIQDLKKGTRKLQSFLFDLRENILVKKVNNLGREILNKDIQEGDILLVDDPNIVSEKIIDSLKDKIDVVICKKKISKKLKEKLDFIFIDANKLRIKEDKDFALVRKEDLEREKSKSDWLARIVEGYREKRK